MHDRAGRRKTVAWFTRNILPEEVIVKGTLVSLGLEIYFRNLQFFLDGQSGFVDTEENRDNYWRLEVQIQISGVFIFPCSHLFSTRTNHTEDCICPRPRVRAKFQNFFYSVDNV